ncbi:MAG: ATP phosphoribosyltransferase regulatory subunit [Gemmatimonadetes bacterium]|nr:ATP phosphoribosyltransferase regulatory subunit [Gemmatimonadota bacterium]
MQFLPISHVPVGSQDLLAEDVRLLRRIHAAWYALAEARGYEEVIPPTFEYEEVFTRGGGPELASRLVRFVDQDGRLVALRADFTSSIARVAASRLASAPVPLRLCYAGKVFRQEAAGEGRRREMFQLGAEMIGDASAEGDVEVIRLLLDTMHAVGIADFQVNLGNVEFVRPLLERLSFEEAEALRGAIDRKDRAALAAAVAAGEIEPGAGRSLVELPTLIGRGEMLIRAAELAIGESASSAIERLRRIDRLLTPAERAHIVYDLGEIRGLGYYTGIQFEVFAAGAGRAIGVGGRYDHLLALYGADRPAVGFALETDALAELLTQAAQR